MKMVRQLPIFMLMVVFLVTTGCAPKTPMPQINAEYYPQCYAPFKQLHESQIALQKRTIGYTAGGAAAGAAGGALIGLIASGGNWKSALAGALTGALSGGLTGYTLAKIQGIKDQQKRMMAYQVTMRADLANSTDVEISALQSLKCYIQEFEQLQKNYAAKIITKEEFVKRYAEIRTGITEIGKITSDSHTMLVQRDAEFRTALQGENGIGQAVPTVEERRVMRDKKAQKVAAKRKRDLKMQRRKSSKREPALENSSQAMAQLKDELDRLQEDAVAKKAQYSAQIQEDQPSSSNASTVKRPVPVSVQQVATTFNDYPDKVLSMESVENQRKKTLEIMNDAAIQSGIDMV